MTNAEPGGIVRRLNDAWNADDWDVLEAVHDPHAEVVAPEIWPEGGTFRGWPAVRRQYERLKDPIEGEQAVLLTLETRGSAVLSSYRWCGRAASSGLDFEMEVWRIDSVRDGLITRTVFVLDDEEAARAAFREQSG